MFQLVISEVFVTHPYCFVSAVSGERLKRLGFTGLIL